MCLPDSRLKLFIGKIFNFHVQKTLDGDERKTHIWDEIQKELTSLKMKSNSSSRSGNKFSEENFFQSKAKNFTNSAIIPLSGLPPLKD